MFNNRMLAVAAVLVLAVPVLGAAAPIVVTTATGEQLVEGHTVFTVIETYDDKDFNGTTRFAAAVAVLVREYKAENRNVRFPGVLWFNDQYLVNPQSGEDNVQAYRYPCGGAVMAVNRNDPDPRVNTFNVNVAGTTTPGYGSTNYNNVNVSVDPNNPNPVSASSDAVISSQTQVAALGVSYKETYTITDPNDHVWVIDRYHGYHRASAADVDQVVYQYPIWVVNILGQPIFRADDGDMDCSPYVDRAVAADPSRNGYCYSGPAATEFGGDCTKAPKRLYNALLYFKLEDLRYAGDVRTHTTTSTDTNGCHVGTEWTCPGGDDNAEGNSHPFHPKTSTGHTDKEPCKAGTTYTPPGSNPTNHGGSSGAIYGEANAGGQYGAFPCDYSHATRDIDIYFSASGRPARPLFSIEKESDTQGSNAPYQDYPTAYSTTHEA